MPEAESRRDRDRSRSPRRDRKPKSKSGSSGFRWKDKKSGPLESDRERKPRSGYRERDYDDDGVDCEQARRRRDRGRDEHSARHDEEERAATTAKGHSNEQTQDRAEGDEADAQQKDSAAPPATIDNDILAKFGASAAAKFSKSAAASAPKPHDPDASTAAVDSAKSARNSDSKPKAAGPRPGEPMILVKVNDRLGTAAQIPCFASDNVGLFKAQVAARIGRRPHEILLKRQGERPFKDVLTLEDYGVSNGVQIDLELAT